MEEKTFSNMPAAVRASALVNRHQWYARAYMHLCERIHVWMDYLVTFSWWTVLYWLVVAKLPFQAIHESIPAVVDFIFKSYLLTFVAVMALHFFETLAFVPLPAKGWPNVGLGTAHTLWGGGRKSGAYSPVFSLAASATVFGSLLVMASLMSSHPNGAASESLYQGIALIGMGLLSVHWDASPPSFGFRVPSLNEVAAGHRACAPVEAGPSRPTGQAANPDYQLPVELKPARYKFGDIFGMQAVKEKLLEAATEIVKGIPAGGDRPSNGILLDGAPGNGKTLFAEALAGELSLPIIKLTYGDVSSKWVGEMPRLISMVFAYAKQNAPCVLFVDEVDSFLTPRGAGTGSSEDLKITNTMLTECVDIRDHQVVLIAATNCLERLDGAGMREGRFDFKVEVTAPDELARIALLRQGAKKHMANLTVDDEALQAVAKRWSGFSVSRLMAVTKAASKIMRGRIDTVVKYEVWTEALREVQGRATMVPQGAKSLTELVLEKRNRIALDAIAARMKDAYRVESLGGTLPTGALFFGPPGTGKSVAAQALAKEVGCSFISVAGPDLLKSADALDRLFARAKDLRPAIVFIDEADDVIRNRQFSGTPQIVNKLLTLLDGGGERIRDILVIAATNDAEAVDPALLRAGRFTEKVFFDVPSAADLPRYIAGWLKNKRVRLEPTIDAFDIAEQLSGQSIANIEGVLQSALNSAITSTTGGAAVVVSQTDILAAQELVLGQGVQARFV